MTDPRRATGQPGQKENPFAPPPEGQPDQPWRPRPPRDSFSGTGPDDGRDGAEGSDGVGGNGSGDGGENGRGDNAGGTGEGDRSHGSGDGEQTPSWGSQWSKRQPGRESGDFGSRPDSGRDNRPPGSKGPGGLRWDPRDPVQRRARYALLAGMWGFFFGLFDVPPLALLLGALAVYWGIGSLRTKPRTGAAVHELRSDGSVREPNRAGTAPGARPQGSAAVMGLVMGALAVLIVAATFTFQIVYSEYFHCAQDALTTPAREACRQHLPEPLRPILDNQG